MTRRAERREEFLREHPRCCFCGGAWPAQTVDHLPSRACFDNKHFPDGFEFPSCLNCNASTSKEEQFVAAFSRTLSHPERPAIGAEIQRYLHGTANNSPQIFRDIRASALPGGGGVIELSPAARSAILTVLQRWAKAFHYRETRVIVPRQARIGVTYFTNLQTDFPSSIMEGEAHTLTRNGKSLGDQAFYISKVDPEDTSCQSAFNIAPRSASKVDPLVVGTDASTRAAAAGRGCGGGARAGSLSD